MTRFEHGDRFVELERAGLELHRRWGAKGRSEHARSETFADDAAASTAWAQQLSRLEQRGYLPGKHNAQLAAVIRDNPDDEDAYLVYADWLLEQNDPRGELISAMVNLQPYDALLAKHAAQFVPAVKSHALYWWHWGFLLKAILHSPAWGTVRRVLQHPSSMVLRKLEVWGFQYGHREPVTMWNALVPFLPPTLERIEVEAIDTLWTERHQLAPELRRLISATVPRVG